MRQQAPDAAPVIAEMRLRSGKTGSGRAAASQVKSAITTARACGASGKIMLRGDSAFGNKKVIGAALEEGIEFSLTMSRNRRIDKAIAAIPDDAWTPVHYPGAVLDPDTGALISDAEVAETSYTAFSGRHRVTARLIVRRVKDANHPTGCSRCGATTRSSPTPTCRSPRPTSPTANTPSWRPCSPI